MHAKIYTHLWYAKDADQAARFYASIFPDSRVERVWTLPTESPSGPEGAVKIVDFVLFGQRFQAMTAGPHHDFNDAMSLVVECADQAELDRFWDALLEGGGKPQACGWLTDRYGVSWQVVPRVLFGLLGSPDRAGAQRAFTAMMTMGKLDIAELQRAHDTP